MINPALTIGLQILLAVAVGAGIGLMTGPTIARLANRLRRHSDITDLLEREDNR